MRSPSANERRESRFRPRRFLRSWPGIALVLYTAVILTTYMQGTLSRYLASADLGGAADIAPWEIEGPPAELDDALDYEGWEQAWKYNNSVEDIKQVILFRDDSNADVPVTFETGTVNNGVTTDFNFLIYDYRLSKPYGWPSHKLDEAALFVPEKSQRNDAYGYPLHEKNQPWDGAGNGVPLYSPPNTPMTIRVPWYDMPVSSVQSDILFLRNLPFYNTYYFTSQTSAARVNGDYNSAFNPNGADFFGGYDGVIWAQDFNTRTTAQNFSTMPLVNNLGLFPDGLSSLSGPVTFGPMNAANFPAGGKSDASDPAMTLNSGVRLAFLHPKRYESLYPGVQEASWAIEFDVSFGNSTNAELLFFPYWQATAYNAVRISGNTANNITGGFSFEYSSSLGTRELSTRITHWNNLSDGGRWNRARIEVQGRRCTGYIDGREVFCITNMLVPTANYSIGFEASGGSVAIDNIILFDLHHNAMDQYEQNIPVQAGGYYKTAAINWEAVQVD